MKKKNRNKSHEDIFKILKIKNFKYKFDLIFLDPPFKEQKVNKFCH